MRFIRHLCDRFPKQRGLFVTLGYTFLLFGGVAWFVCLVWPAIALTFLDRSQLTIQAIFWFFTAFGLVMIYFNVKTLRELRQKP
jgi:hypothetical protein